MQLTMHPDAAAFLRDAQEELELREAEHSLVLGVALALRDAPPARGAFLATARDGAGLALAALVAPPHPLIVAACREDAGAALPGLLGALRDAGRRVSAVLARPPYAEELARLWSGATGRAAQLAMRQRLHALTRVEPVPMAPGRLRPAGEGDLEVVAGWIAAFDAEALGEGTPEQARAVARRRTAAGELFLWEDGEPRTMAARARPTRRSVAVNAVYTPPTMRGRGYATACVAALSRRLLDEGRETCVLFTDLANPTSNAIYARIGYRPVCDFTLYRFGGE